jgi:hypothetical protein
VTVVTPTGDALHSREHKALSKLIVVLIDKVPQQEEAIMEGSSFVPPNRPEEPEVLICTQCGKPFHSHEAADAAEELCNRCFEARFSPATPEHVALLHGEEIEADVIAA